MKEKAGSMNIPFSEVYNEEDDIYYVTFKTAEPSYCCEVDDVFILELGLFTNLPTGFRILNFKENKVGFVRFGMLFRKIKKTLQKVHRPSLVERETQVKKALEEVLV